ncbi:hypothetical protein [Haloarchaeobius sp. DFWS5]|uniref:hypothetical protein n=1 Tax=Haloarchaeobius sp. DFWS5 TaxID=3446114 RepID=UPI003EBE2ECA
MRQRSINHFLGSFFSKQLILAYGIANGFSTSVQLVMILVGKAVWTRDTEGLIMVLELYVETLYPRFIGGLTQWNMVMILLNLVVAVTLLAHWSLKYDRAF